MKTDIYMNYISDKNILNGFTSFDETITQEYFYGYCRRAYDIFDRKYQLHDKAGMDFYSLAHDYYIQLLTHDFKPLLSKPQEVKLSSWMVKGFHFVVLDALKAYNKEYDIRSAEPSDAVLEYIRSTDKEEGMLFDVAEAVSSHYNDRVMQEIAHMVLFAGYKQNEVAAQLGVTPAAVNLRYKKMMDEVVTPFIMENYANGLYLGMMAESDLVINCNMIAEPTYKGFAKGHSPQMLGKRITPSAIASLSANQIFVFGSNLKGIHAGGAARTARLCFGAEIGNGVGPQGQSYAIPTMQGGVDTIQPYVDDFIAYARSHSQQLFLVTPIGCGIAGFTPEDIAPLFHEAQQVENICLPQEFWDIITI